MPTTLTKDDIKARYKVKDHVAYRILREIRDYTQSVLPRGRCLIEEAEAWERRNLNKLKENDNA